MTVLALDGGVEHLTQQLVDVPSVSGNEGTLADAVQEALVRVDHLAVTRDEDAVCARTQLGRPTRVVVAGHLDTVPIADNVPARRDGDRLLGCGTSDMKSGLAVMLRLAATVAQPRHDVTWLFYDHEEVAADKNGLGRIEQRHPDWMAGDLAVLMEPTRGRVEAGCQGTLRALVAVGGTRAHSARPWLGSNAIHAAGEVLRRLADYEARRVEIDGCEYREGLSAVRVEGGVAGNVIPDRCTVTVNFRFAPDRTPEQAVEHVTEVLHPFEPVVVDLAPGALPGLGAPAVADFVERTGLEPQAKYGWTDVARFTGRGVPALNYGPGDPDLAHTRDEWVDLRRVAEAERVMRQYLEH